jgi:tRNA (mo5U34)-methyltransferase
MSRAEIEQRVRDLGDWFHNMNLGGVQTAPNHFLGDYPAVKWQRFSAAIPADLSGWTVLDIGCNAGFYSQEMKRRGAAHVIGIDSDSRYLAQARFAADVAGLDIEFRQMSVYDLPLMGERFDLVLFMGVLYHLRHPLLALDILYSHAVRRMLVCQSMLRGSDEVRRLPPDWDFTDTAPFVEPAFPRMYFIERKYAGDPTNWWIPNRSRLEGMLRSAGFEITGHPEPEVFICQPLDPSKRAPLPEQEMPWWKR